MDFDRLENWVNKIFESCKEYVLSSLNENNKKLPVVHFSVSLENNVINATAKSINHSYLVEIGIATLRVFESYYATILHELNIRKWLQLEENCSKELEDLYFQYMFTYTIKMILFHELGHICNEHLDYMKEKKHFEEYKLDELNNISESDILETQAIEWNADDFAATRLIGQTTYNKNLNLYGFDITKNHAMILNYFIIVSLFSILGMSKQSENVNLYNDLSKNHLPKRFRCISTLLSAQKAYITMNKISDEIDYDAFYKLIIKYERVPIEFMKIYDKQKKQFWDRYSNLTQLDEKHAEYYKIVDTYYKNEMTAKISKYSYMEKVYE